MGFFPLFFCPCSATLTKTPLRCDKWNVKVPYLQVEAVHYDDLCHMDPFTGGIKIPLQLEDAS